jgi:hypothetical protein
MAMGGRRGVQRWSAAVLFVIATTTLYCGGSITDGATCVDAPTAGAACMPGVPACLPPPAQSCAPSWKCDPTTHQWDEAIPNCAVGPAGHVGGDGGLPGDAGDSSASASVDAAPSGPGAPCTPIVPSDYDQSCATDEDCVVVGDLPACPPPTCLACDQTSLNKGAAVKYQAALSRALAAFDASPGPCNCPCESGLALCRGGTCQVASCGAPIGDTLPACRDAGGQCAYAGNATCVRNGPAGSCAYSDEVCCL